MNGTLHGANRPKVDALFRELGGTIVPVRRHGEARYYHPKFPRPITVNIRRKDIVRQITKLVMRLAAEAA